MSVDHWMTFGTFAEQRYFTYPSPDTYTGVIINANMLAHAPSGLAAFLLEKTRPDFPYLIDPLTHAFQHEISTLKNRDGKIKSSLENLAKEYGKLVHENVGIRPLTPKDFSNEDLFVDFVENCLNFQEGKLSTAIKSKEEIKYLREFGEGVNLPYALVAPYFYIDEITIDDWLPVLKKSAEIALHIKRDSRFKIFSAIVISKGILQEKELIDQLITELDKLDVDGFLFWVDDLDETNTSRAILNGLLLLSQGLRAGGRKELINLHGGYFSLLSSSGQFGDSAFSGVSHGPEFGEFRQTVPVGGGIPVAKFYVRQLHSRINYRKALGYFRKLNWLESAATFYENVCDCQECRIVIGDDPNNFTIYGISETKLIQRGRSSVSMEYSVKETKEHCLKHYLNKKRDEYKFVSEAPREELLRNLKSAEAEFIDIGGMDAVSHLTLWHNILTKKT